MTVRVTELLGICGALVFGACAGDPLSDLNGAPAEIVTNFAALNVAVGDTASFTAQVLDGRGIPLEVSITFTARSGAARAVRDPAYQPVPPTSARALVIGLAPGSTWVVAESGGTRDSVRVTVQ